MMRAQFAAPAALRRWAGVLTFSLAMLAALAACDGGGGSSGTLTLLPNTLTVGEDTSSNLVLSIDGGAGPFTAYTNDALLSGVTVSGSSLVIGLGSQNSRCITPLDSEGAYAPRGTVDILLTLVDSAGHSVTSTLTIQDNAVGDGKKGGTVFVATCN